MSAQYALAISISNQFFSMTRSPPYAKYRELDLECLAASHEIGKEILRRYTINIIRTCINNYVFTFLFVCINAKIPNIYDNTYIHNHA